MKYPELNSLSLVLCLNGEEWRDVVGYEGIYQVSSLGRVKRLQRTQMNRNQVCEFPVTYPEIVMQIHPDSHGYPQAVLSHPIRRVARVHRLVAEAFLEEPSEALKADCYEAGFDCVLVNHKDTDPMNATLDNLEWCSLAYNNQYRADERSYAGNRGANNYCATLTEDDVTEIITLLQQKVMSQEKIAALYGVKQITISNIWTGRSWAWYTGIERKPRSIKRKAKSEPMAEAVYH